MLSLVTKVTTAKRDNNDDAEVARDNRSTERWVTNWARFKLQARVMSAPTKVGLLAYTRMNRTMLVQRVLKVVKIHAPYRYSVSYNGHKCI